MKSATRETLRDVNRRFYARHAESFSATRERPWTGWDRVVRRAEVSGCEGGPLRILDAGCGNGRFGSFLMDRGLEGMDYVGIDSSPELLDRARQRLRGFVSSGRAKVGFSEEDLMEMDSAISSRAPFQLIALFGVLHHVPGWACRSSLIRRLARGLKKGGLLAISIWRLERIPNLSRKVVPWNEYNRRLPRSIDLAELDPGDFLLTWAGERSVPRYCHLAEDEEIESWSQASGLACVDRFSSDGPDHRHNLYLVLKRL